MGEYQTLSDSPYIWIMYWVKVVWNRQSEWANNIPASGPELPRLEDEILGLKSAWYIKAAKSSDGYTAKTANYGMVAG